MWKSTAHRYALLRCRATDSCVHTVAALPPDQAADLPKLSCLNFNEHLTSFPVTLNKSENAMGNIITLLRAFRRSEVAL